MEPILYSIFKGARGRPIGKAFSLIDGRLDQSSCCFSNGTVRRAKAASLAEFSQQLTGFQTNEALCVGVCAKAEASVITRAQLGRSKSRDGVITRTRDYFDWPSECGLMPFDYDPPDGTPAKGPAELIRALRDAIPELALIAFLHKGSSSSCLYGLDGTELVSMRGQHLFAAVNDARQIPIIARRISDRLWLAGHGRFDVAKNGQLLERSLVDLAVWQPERLFYQRATCHAGVIQKLPPYKIFPGSADAIFGEGRLGEELIPPLTESEQKRLEDKKREARQAMSSAAESRRAEWIDCLVSQFSGQCGGGDTPDRLRSSICQALEAGRLPAQLELIAEDGQRVRVDELLKDPEHWHEKRFADPIDPGYRGDLRIAVAVLEGTRTPHIYSHAHGGIRYALVDAVQPSTSDDFDNLTNVALGNGHLRIMPASEFARGRRVKWLIKGLLAQASLAMVFGPSGSGKSFLVLDLIWAISAGRLWKGLRTKKGRALYVVAEGASGFRKRLQALAQFHGPELETSEIWVCDGLDLRTSNHEELIAWVKQLGGVDIIVIDTLAQVIAGADENSAQDMAPVLKRCKTIIDETGATVLLVHHAGKAVERGARGWSGIRAALDTEIEVTKQGKTSIAKVTKQKDSEGDQCHAFGLTLVDLGADEDGDALTSCVVHYQADIPTRPRKLTGRWQRHVFEVLGEMEAFGPVSRHHLLSECLRRAEEFGENNTRLGEVIGRALKGLLSIGLVFEMPEGVCSRKPTSDPQMADLRCAPEQSPTPHDSKECGGMCLTEVEAGAGAAHHARRLPGRSVTPEAANVGSG